MKYVAMLMYTLSDQEKEGEDPLHPSSMSTLAWHRLPSTDIVLDRIRS